jgi:hypothetical protein
MHPVERSPYVFMEAAGDDAGSRNTSWLRPVHVRPSRCIFWAKIRSPLRAFSKRGARSGTRVQPGAARQPLEAQPVTYKTTPPAINGRLSAESDKNSHNLTSNMGTAGCVISVGASPS